MTINSSYQAYQNKLQELFGHVSMRHEAGSVKEYDDKDGNKATASFKGDFVAASYEYKSANEKASLALPKEEMVPRLKNLKSGDGEISIIGIKINSLQKTSFKLAGDNEKLTYEGVSLDYSTYGVSGKIDKLDMRGHEELLRLFSKINITA